MLAGETVPVFLWFLHTRYVSQFCLYLGIDVAAEPDLITEVDDYLKRPLPEGSGDSEVKLDLATCLCYSRIGIYRENLISWNMRQCVITLYPW